MKQLRDYVNAAFSGLWVQTHEPDEAEREIARLAADNNWKIIAWDIARGVRFPNNQASMEPGSGAGEPLVPLKALPSMASTDGAALLVLHNYHKFLQQPEVLQTVFNQLIAGKEQRTFVVVLAPNATIPVELEKLFVVVDHDLPDREQLESLARSLLRDGEQVADMKASIDAAVGLTRYEAEGAFALSLARHGQLKPSSIWELKTAAMKKNDLLTLYRGTETFNSLGGLDELKAFCKGSLLSKSKARPKGVILLSPPGCGKSSFCKALGNEVGRPTLCLNSSKIKTKNYGESEQRLAQVFKIADAMAPCILFIDEVEGFLAGANRAGDPGVTMSLGKLLSTWLNDHESDVYTVCTSNNISELPQEFKRAERFDGVYFVDLPNKEEKERIWEMYLKEYDITQYWASGWEDNNWTGAEIKACCRLASLLGTTLAEAAQRIVPEANSKHVEDLRAWASGRCLDARKPGMFQHAAVPEIRHGRHVQRGPTTRPQEN